MAGRSRDEGLGVLQPSLRMASHQISKTRHADNAVIMIKVLFKNYVICVGIYFPADRSSPDYINSISSINGFIDSIIDNNPGYTLLATHLSFLVISTFNVWLVIKVMMFFVVCK